MRLVIKNIFNNPVSGSTDLFQKISYSIIAVIVASILFSLIQKNFVFNIEILIYIKTILVILKRLIINHLTL